MANVKTLGDGGSRAEDARAAEFGAALRQTRIAHGRELAEVGAQLRIRQVYLQAMEDGRFDDLPGPTYAIGFVRAYADYLGLDEDEVVKRYKELRGGAGAPANLVPPVAPVTEGRLPTGSVLLLAAVLAAAAYGGWYYLSMKGRDPGAVVAALPDRIAAMVGLKRAHVPSPDPAPPAATAVSPMAEQSPPASSSESSAPSFEPMAPTSPGAVPGTAASTQPATPDSGPPPAEPARARNEPAETVTAIPTQPVAPAEPPPEARTAESAPVPVANPPSVAVAPPPPQSAESTPPASPTEQTVPGSPSQPSTAAARPPESPMTPAAPPVAPDPASQTAARVDPASNARVVLRANASAWVEIRNAEDRRVFSRLMRAGETYAVPATPGLMLTTGNAGGLAIVVDGKAMPPLGRQGDVRRDVALDADMLLRNTGTAP